jgi:hypothetical protein
VRRRAFSATVSYARAACRASCLHWAAWSPGREACRARGGTARPSCRPSGRIGTPVANTNAIRFRWRSGGGRSGSNDGERLIGAEGGVLKTRLFMRSRDGGTNQTGEGRQGQAVARGGPCAPAPRLSLTCMRCDPIGNSAAHRISHALRLSKRSPASSRVQHTVQ